MSSWGSFIWGVLSGSKPSITSSSFITNFWVIKYSFSPSILFEFFNFVIIFFWSSVKSILLLNFCVSILFSIVVDFFHCLTYSSISSRMDCCSSSFKLNSFWSPLAPFGFDFSALLILSFKLLNSFDNFSFF